MSDLRKAAQQALEALDSDHPDIHLRAAITLRAALAQPEPEPVANQTKTSGSPLRVVFPRHTPRHGEDWVIDPAFLSRVYHSVSPDTPAEFSPSPEEIETALLSLEVIPAHMFIAPVPCPTCEALALAVMMDQTGVA